MEATEKLNQIGKQAQFTDELPVPKGSRELLNWLAERAGTDIFLSNKELAKQFACSTTTIGRYLRLFEKLGYVKNSRRISQRRYVVNRDFIINYFLPNLKNHQAKSGEEFYVKIGQDCFKAYR